MVPLAVPVSTFPIRMVPIFPQVAEFWISTETVPAAVHPVPTGEHPPTCAYGGYGRKQARDAVPLLPTPGKAVVGSTEKEHQRVGAATPGVIFGL